MMPSRPRLILLIMVALALVLGVLLFVVPHNGRDQTVNPAPHAPDQTPQ
ncbi:hypothetical protein PY650_22695 [Rhizobium calliandrae]|uniref:Uncharacterized protein n=1 Tax=Rhizobium calliandrae TaxID=1312182 RepID=A0ABT7KIF1_9HYPH|nr:hypothetical protein [Rhizobium calliandrae]MDL2408406.1 hypothetical protein [Rhizobium calliandrae]